MKLFFIRNKKTGRLLQTDIEKEDRYDYGIDGEVKYTHTWTLLHDSDYSGEFFCTDKIDTVEELLEKGKCLWPDIQLDLNWRTNKFKLEDLEMVAVEV